MNVLQKGASRVQYTQKVTLSMWFSFAISAATKMEVMYTENQYTENQTYMSIMYVNICELMQKEVCISPRLCFFIW